jgi:hypothetical protein
MSSNSYVYVASTIHCGESSTDVAVVGSDNAALREPLWAINHEINMIRGMT